MHAQIADRKHVTINGMQGTRMVVAFAIVGEQITQDELLLVSENRLFQLNVLSGATRLDPSNVNRFFQSIKLTGEPKAWKRSWSDPNSVVERTEPDDQQITNGIVAFDCPTYPVPAKKNHPGGIVEIQVTTDGGKITDMKVKGHPLLAEAATENVRSWKFSDKAARKFTVGYLYTFDGEYDPDPVYHCRAKLKLPESVEVSTSF